MFILPGLFGTVAVVAAGAAALVLGEMRLLARYEASAREGYALASDNLRIAHMANGLAQMGFEDARLRRAGVEELNGRIQALTARAARIPARGALDDHPAIHEVRDAAIRMKSNAAALAGHAGPDLITALHGVEAAAHDRGQASSKLARGQADLAKEARQRAERLLISSTVGLVLLIAAMLIFVVRPMIRRAQRRATELEARMARAERESRRDRPTGLPNLQGLRRLLSNRLIREGSRPAVIHLALEQALLARGAMTGERADALAQAAGGRLLRLTGPGEVPGRVGASEFAVVIDEVRHASEAMVAARRLASGMAATAGETGELRAFPVRAGVALASPARRDPDALLEDAEAALGAALRPGAPNCMLCTPALRQGLENDLRLAEDLASAMTRGEITPFLQPQVNLRDGRIAGFEALVRWRHSRRGLVGPGQFVGLAERTGQMAALGDVVVRASLDMLAGWRARGLPVPGVAVNMSAQELRDPALVDKLLWDVDAVGLSPADLSLEILESVMFEGDADPAIRTVAWLADAGFSIELDDFGAGHAAIANLRKLKVHRIKLDRDLVHGMETDLDRRKIVRGIAALAASLEIEVLAEGVESLTEAAIAADLGCELVQGYSVGRPMPQEEAEAWIAAWEPQRFLDQLAAAVRPRAEDRPALAIATRSRS